MSLRLRGRITPVLLATSLLVLGVNLGAHASTGKPFLLGKTNTATRPRVLRTTGRGPAPVLKAGKSPPLAVTSEVEVANLDADQLDGLTADALQTKAYDFVIFVIPETAEGKTQDVTVAPPPGHYLVSYSVVLDFETDADHFAECRWGPRGQSQRAFATPKAASVGGTSVVFNANATAEVTIGGGGLLLTCDSLDPFRLDTFTGGIQSTLDLVRLDTVVSGTPGVVTGP